MKVRIKLTKIGSIRFVGHLDFMRFFQKALRKSGIACAFSKGFSPHLLISFASPLGVGLESVGEYVDVELAYRDPFEMARDDLEKLKSMGLVNDELPEVPPSEELLSKINAIMPEGVLALEMTRVEENKGKAMAMVRGADYLVFLEEGYLPGITDPETISGFLTREEIVIHKVSKKTESDTDIKPLLYNMKKLDFGEAADMIDHRIGSAGGCEGGDLGHRFRAGAAAGFLTATENQRRKMQAGTDPERADSLRRVDFMPGDGNQIGTEGAGLERDLPKGLDRICME